MSEPIYRVDKFIVPANAMPEFMDKVQKSHALLRTQPGFLQDFILEQSTGPGKFNIVTIVEWENAHAIELARSEVQALHHRMNFDPQEMFTWFGITADLANYNRIDS